MVKPAILTVTVLSAFTPLSAAHACQTGHKYCGWHLLEIGMPQSNVATFLDVSWSKRLGSREVPGRGQSGAMAQPCRTYLAQYRPVSLRLWNWWQGVDLT